MSIHAVSKIAVGRCPGICPECECKRCYLIIDAGDMVFYKCPDCGIGFVVMLPDEEGG